MLEKSIEFFATLGPIGKKCPAPGTFGSLAGLLLVLLLSWSTQLPLITISLFFVPLIFLGIPLCTQAEKSLGKGFGVMIDDVLAAAYAAGLLYLTFTFSLSFF